MRVYIPSSCDKKVDKALKELELFKQSMLHGGNGSIKDLERIIELLSSEPKLQECINMLKATHHVVDVETNLLIVERLRNIMRNLNSFR